jgi:hypothetical protein
MIRSRWTNIITGDRLSRVELEAWRQRARLVYQANSHIFEDEVEALAALGVVPARDPHPAENPYVPAPLPPAA